MPSQQCAAAAALQAETPCTSCTHTHTHTHTPGGINKLDQYVVPVRRFMAAIYLCSLHTPCRVHTTPITTGHEHYMILLWRSSHHMQYVIETQHESVRSLRSLCTVDAMS
jgi:hypothetical protein